MTVEERRFAALRATETARRGADRPRLFGAAFGLCAGLALSACVPEVKSGTQDSGVVALYNPSSTPAVVPAPNDLVRAGGKLQIPVDASEAKVPALKAFNDYLRSLDGYPPDSTASTSFAADIAAFAPAGEDVIGPLEQRAFALVNAARAEQLPRWLNRGPLRWHSALAAVARQHSADMLQRRYVAHVTPDGLNVSGRLERAAISYLACGENIGVVYGPASHGENGLIEVQNAFMSQPRRLANHRGNILNPVWTHVGIGVAYSPEGQLIVTQNFVATLTNPA